MGWMIQYHEGYSCNAFPKQIRKKFSFFNGGRSWEVNWGSQKLKHLGVGWIIYLKLNSLRMMKMSGRKTASQVLKLLMNAKAWSRGKWQQKGE